jgi:hypothetical protein
MKSFFALPILFLITSLPSFGSEIVTFNANKACASVVGIPYASDNFTEKEYKEFSACVLTMKYFQKVYPQ